MRGKVFNVVTTVISVVWFICVIGSITFLVMFFGFWDNSKWLQKKTINSCYDYNSEIIMIVEEMLEYPGRLLYVDETDIITDTGVQNRDVNNVILDNNCYNIIDGLLKKKIFISIKKEDNQVFFLKYSRFKRGYGLVYSINSINKEEYIKIIPLSDFWYYYEER